MPSTEAVAILLNFAEPNSGVLPEDEAGGLERLEGDTGSTPALTVPDSVESLSGRGREFTTDEAFVAEELTADQTKLLRDCTIEAVVNFNVAGVSRRECAPLRCLAPRGR